MTQKALLQSAGDGTAVPSGYIGEVLSSNTSGTTISTSGTQSLSLTLTAGIWATYISVTYNGSSTVTGMQMGISTSNSSFDSTNADAKLFLTGGSTAGFIAGSIGPRIFTVSSGTTQTIYTWGVAGGASATSVIMTFKAVRIA